AVERRSPNPAVAPGPIEDADLAVSGRASGVLEMERDGRAVRAPRRALVGGPRLGEALGFGVTALGGHHEQVDAEVEVPCVVATGREGEGSTVRRPRQAAVLELTGRHRHRLRFTVGPGDGDHEQMGGPVADPAHAVEAGHEARHPPGWLVLLLLLAVALLVSLSAGEGEPSAVRRPGHLADLVLPGEERAGLAAPCRDDAQLALRLAVSPAHEGQGRAVR